MITRAARARYATKASIARAMAVARACGIDPGGLELAPDGTIRIIPASARPLDLFEQLEAQGKL